MDSCTPWLRGGVPVCGVTIVGSDVAVLGSREQTMLDVCAAVFVFVWWTTMMSTCVCRVVVWSCGVCSGQGVVTAGIPSNACVNTHHNTAVERKPGQLQTVSTACAGNGDVACGGHEAWTTRSAWCYSRCGSVSVRLNVAVQWWRGHLTDDGRANSRTVAVSCLVMLATVY